MDEILYEALSKYYHLLELTGFVSKEQSDKLLVLWFFRDFICDDYRGLLSKEDYRLIEQALDCIYGSSCLIPYPRYLQMGRLHLGEITEMSQRIKNLEDTNVVKTIYDLNSVDDSIVSDVLILEEDSNGNLLIT